MLHITKSYVILIEETQANLCINNHSFKLSRIGNKEGNALGQNSFQVNEAEKNFRLHIAGLNLVYTFMYKIWTLPEFMFINQNNTGKIELASGGLDLVMEMRVGENGAAQINPLHIELVDPKYDVFLGKNDHRLSNGVEAILNNFKPFFEKEFPELLERHIK